MFLNILTRLMFSLHLSKFHFYQWGQGAETRKNEFGIAEINTQNAWSRPTFSCFHLKDILNLRKKYCSIGKSKCN